ncbi:MAG TPA: response regulator [Leucothrix sp.]|nr:response regulator [Leucothrix sp.]
MNKPTILLVEDDQELADLTRDYLQNHSLSVACEMDGENAVSRIIKEQPDLVILDIMLPNKDGFTICREVRQKYTGAILMLTARDEDMDQLLGLELGADDYVTKPVKPVLLLARIHSLLRRIHPANNTADSFKSGNLSIDKSRREVSFNKKYIDFTTAEFDLLLLLAQHAGTVLSREEIYQHLRGIGYDGSNRTIDLRISRLRQKLAEYLGETTVIKTVRGAGYLFITHL